MTLPNFLIIGAAKSGTSALYRYMKQHPDIYMSPIKETHFFSYKDSPPNAQGPGDTVNQAVTDYDSYISLFGGATTESAIGEASPTYIYIPRACEIIQEIVPEAKLIGILRQPADRAFSAYMHVTRDNREPITDFKKALTLEEERTAKNWGPIWHYVKMGLYYEQLRRYYDRFDRRQLQIHLYEDFSADPMTTLKDNFEFLGVDPSFKPDTRIRANVSGLKKNKILGLMTDQLFGRPNPIRYASRRILSEELRWNFTQNIRNRNLEHQKIPPDIRKELTQYYRDDILKLQELIDRDLSIWLNQ